MSEFPGRQGQNAGDSLTLNPLRFGEDFCAPAFQALGKFIITILFGELVGIVAVPVTQIVPHAFRMEDLVKWPFGFREKQLQPKIGERAPTTADRIADDLGTFVPPRQVGNQIIDAAELIRTKRVLNSGYAHRIDEQQNQADDFYWK